MSKLIFNLITRVSYIFLILFIGFGLFGLTQSPVHAQTISDLTVVRVGTTNDIEDLILAISSFLYNIATSVAILVLIWGGYQFFIGATDEGKTNGLKTIRAATIGLVIVLSAGAISTLIRNTITPTGLETGPLIAVLRSLASNLTLLAVLSATGAIIWGGYKDFLKAFDEKTSGTEAVKYGIFGLSVIFLAGAFANAIQNSLQGQNNLGTAIQRLINQFITPTLTSLVGALTALAYIVCVLVIVKGGFDYYSESIDKKTKGAETIQKGVIGFSLVLLSGAIANLIQRFFGARITNVDAANSFRFSQLPTQAREILAPVVQNGVNFFLALSSVVAVLVIIVSAYRYYQSALPNQKAQAAETFAQGVIGLIVTIIATPLVDLIEITISPSRGPAPTIRFSPAGIATLIQNLVSNLLIPISSIVTVFFLVLAGYYWISSAGSPDLAKKGRAALQNALIGFLVTLLATTIVQLIIFFVDAEEFIRPQTSTQAPTPTPTTP